MPKKEKKMKKTNNTKTNSKQKTRIIAGAGMLTAVAAVLQFIEISIPLVPSFIKLDFSDLPALIGAFAYGPLAGILIELLKNIIHLAFSGSMYIGELSNFILGAVFMGTAGLIYKKKKTKTGAVIAGLAGSLVMALVSIVTNYYIIYPMYYSVLGFPEQAILQMYQAIVPGTKSILHALIIFNVPFTFIKGTICAVVSMLVYKPLSPVLHGKKQ